MLYCFVHQHRTEILYMSLHSMGSRTLISSLSFNHFKDGEAGPFGLTQHKSLLWLLPKRFFKDNYIMHDCKL